MFKRNNWAVILLVLFLSVVFFVQPVHAGDTGTYVIDQYFVTITPQADGTLAAHYHQQWSVTGGHIPWITVGLPNPDFTIGTATGNVAKISNANDGSWSGIRLDLDQDYQPGQKFSVDFDVTLQHMAYPEPNTKDAITFELIPGWYDNAPVTSLRIAWRLPDDPSLVQELRPQPTTKEGNTVYWTTSLTNGAKYTVQFVYKRAAFPNLKEDAAMRQENASGWGPAQIVIGFFVLLVILAVLLLIITALAGDDVGGYGGTGRGYSGGGFHSSCACACACACAGGSGAGCAAKGIKVPATALGGQHASEEKRAPNRRRRRTLWR